MTAPDIWQPSHADFIADPYSRYSKLLDRSPVFQAITGDYVVLSYEDVKQVLLDKTCRSGARAEWTEKMREYGATRGMDYSKSAAGMAGMLIQMNPPVHTALRAALSKHWPDKESLSAMASVICADIVGSLPTGSFDLVPEVSKKLPLFMICDLMGIPREDGKNLIDDGFQMVQLLDPYLTIKDLKKIENAASHLHRYFQDFHEKVDPQADALSGAIKKLYPDHKDAIGPMIFLFIAGFETTSALISYCLKQLIEEKSLASQLRADHDLIERFVLEMLRLYTPVQLTGRTNTRAMVLSGVEIPENSTLTLCIGSANRDPAHFPNPNQMGLNRNKYDHLAFGYGIHHCLGRQMAQIEAIELIKSMLPFVDQLSIAVPPPAKTKLTIQSVTSLMVSRLNN